MAQMGFFDLSDCYAGLDAHRDPLVEIDDHTLGGISPSAGTDLAQARGGAQVAGGAQADGRGGQPPAVV